MSFLLPWGLLAALTLPFILILYMLKRKTRLEPVSSILLWERLEQFIAPAININRLRKNLLLFLQLAIALLLALALAQPAINWLGASTKGGTTLVIIDTSISMAIVDRNQSNTRLERARQQIRDLITSKGPREKVALIGMAEQAYLISGVSTDSITLLKSLENIAITGAKANISDALMVAENIARTQEEASLVIISDGLFDDSEQGVSFPVSYLPLGDSPVENLAIENMLIDQSRLYLSVHNNGSIHSRGKVQVKNSEGQVVGEREVGLDPGESKLFIWRELDPSPWYQGEISNNSDQLSMDNLCYTISGREEKNKLLLVTAGNLFLEQALMLQPSLSITRVKPEHYRPSLAGEYDLFVFDGFLPEQLPAAPVLAFDPPHPNRHLEDSPPAAAGVLLPSSHLLLSHVDLLEVRISFSKLLSGGDPLLKSDKGTLAAEYIQQGQPLIVFGFAVQAGDLPLRPAFPILIRNIVDYFTGLDLNLGRFIYGQPLIIEPPYRIDKLRVTFPGGMGVTAVAPFPFNGPQLLEMGIYTVAANNKDLGEITEMIAVNPPVTTETLGFRSSIQINGKTVTERSERRARTPVHTPLLLITLFIMGLEWWVDNRGY